MAFLDTLIKKPTASTGFLDAVVNKPVANPYAGTLGDLGSIGMPSFNMKTSTQAIPDATTPDTAGFVKQAIGFPLRAGIQGALTLAPESVRQNIGTITPEADFGKFAASFIGKEPINAAQTDIPTVTQNLKDKGYGDFMSNVIAHVGVNGNIAIGLLPFVGSLERGGIKSLSKLLAGIDDAKSIETLLVKNGVEQTLAIDYAKMFAPMKDAGQIEKGLLNLEKMQNTTKDSSLIYSNNDKIQITDKATGKTQEGFVYQSPTNGLMMKDVSSGIPRTLDINKFDISLLEKNSPEAPKPRMGINSPDMIASESSLAKEAYHVLANPGKVGANELMHIPVVGRPVDLGVPGVTQEFFIHRPILNGASLDKGWVVSERSTGMSIFSGSDSTQKVAIERARAIIGKAGPEGTMRAVSTQVERYGKTPTANSPRVPTATVAQGVADTRPTLQILPEQMIPVSGKETTIPPPSASLPAVKHIPEDLAQPFKQVVDIGVQATKEPTLYARVTNKLSKGFRSVVEYVQDSEVRVRKLLEQPGMKVTDTNNAYQKATLYPGRVASKIEDAHAQIETMANDLVNIADKSGRDIPTIRQDVNEFLQATHAPERNAALGDGAAGMTNEQAAKTLERINTSPDVAAIRQVAEQARKLNEQGLVLLRDSGVISEDLFKTLTVKYPNHVPLQRIFDTEEIQSALSVRGFDVKSSGIKTAKGSKRQVADILSNIQHNYEQAVLRSEKNIVDQATLAFARDNREALKGLIEVRKPRAIGKSFDNKILMEKTGDPSYLQMYENGRPIWIKINDPALALAFRGVAREKLPSLLNGIGAFTRFYAGLATRFNPEFAFPNKIRDLQETMIYLAAQKDVGFKGAAKLMAKDPGSVKAVWDSIRGVDSAGARMYAEMKAMGGTTGGFGLSTRKQVELDLENMINTAKSRPRQAAADVIQYVDNWNTVFEDSTRLSVYKQALSQGASKERAAFLAKEASINFNRMGRGGPVVNAIWMFANASIQGSAKMLRSLRNPKVAVAVIATIGASTAAVNEWNDHVDPQWRDKVTKWDRLNGLPIVLPPGKDGGVHYVVIPVSWGVKPIKVMADYAYDMTSGQASNLGKMASDLFAATADAYNPLSGTDAVSALTPTIIDVPVEIVRNQSWSGSKIRPDFDKNAPKDVQYFSTLGESASGKLFIDMTKKLQETTGIAISPADMKYAFDQYIGGAGKASAKAANTILGVATSKPPPADEYPFVSRFYRTRTQEEVGQGAGGDTAVLKSVLENQSRDRFYATQAAEDKYTQLKALAPAEAAKQWQAIYAKDPVLGAKVSDIAKKDKLGLDYTERLITQLGVADGQRALYLKGKFDALKSNTDKGTLWQDYVTKGIITTQVADQISYLLANPQVGKKSTP